MKPTVLTAILVFAGAGILPAAPESATQQVTRLSLTEAQALALRQHPQIASASYLVLAAQEVANESRAEYFPQVNLYGTAVAANDENTRILAGGLNNPSIYDRAAGGLQINQLITDFGRTANRTASAKLQAAAEGENLELTRERVLLEVSRSYYETLAAQTVLNVAQQTMQTRQVLLEQVSALATNQMRSQLDVSFAQVQLQQARLLVEQAQNNADAALATLSTAIGYGEFHALQLEAPAASASPVDTNVTDLVQIALSHRPELLRLRDESEAARKTARAERDARYPTVSAVGVAGGAPTHDSHLPDDYAAGGVQLNLPLFAGGYYRARQHEAELRAKSAAELERSLADDVIRDVRIAWLTVNSAQQQLITTEDLVQNAQEAFTLANTRYNNGISSIVELSEAQLNLTEAQISAANARYGLLIQRANLAYQTGELRME